MARGTVRPHVVGRSTRSREAEGASPSPAAPGGGLVVVWSPAGDSAGELVWQLALGLAAQKQRVLVADLDLYTPSLAVAAGLLTPTTTDPVVLDACLAQQAPALTARGYPSGGQGGGHGSTPRLLQPAGQALVRMLPGLIDLRGLDSLVAGHFDTLAAWLEAESGWRIVTVSAAADCASTVACLEVADRLLLHVPQHTGRPASVAQFWLARAVHLLRSLPAVQADPELWLPGWDAGAAREIGVSLQCAAHALPVSGRRRPEILAQTLGDKGNNTALPSRGEIVAVR